MSSSSRLSTSVSTSRLGSVGIFSIGVIAFALTALQGCSPTVTASSAKEPGASVPGLGHIRPDAPTHVEPRYVSESRPADRAEARSHESRGNRLSFCRRCSN
ncbi:MAG: hypothetical protein JWO86_4854 [Myxococcaceae bacterium]|jgi:hypothetical protein|nr:hypothetical protein [Myxococcaceae bacterium]MEA2753666.1 hypothetical protein [Myxococcales bacterium]